MLKRVFQTPFSLFRKIKVSGGVRTPCLDLLLIYVFLCFVCFDFYTKTTDVEFYSQITATSGPRVCLGYLNHNEKSQYTRQSTQFLDICSNNSDFTQEKQGFWGLVEYQQPYTTSKQTNAFGRVRFL